MSFFVQDLPTWVAKSVIDLRALDKLAEKENARSLLQQPNLQGKVDLENWTRSVPRPGYEAHLANLDGFRARVGGGGVTGGPRVVGA